MSADNWTSCPKCGDREDDNRAGTGTLREDYEIGIYNGEFDISYRASCTNCNYKKVFEHTENIT